MNNIYKYSPYFVILELSFSHSSTRCGTITLDLSIVFKDHKSSVCNGRLYPKTVILKKECKKIHLNGCFFSLLKSYWTITKVPTFDRAKLQKWQSPPKNPIIGLALAFNKITFINLKLYFKNGFCRSLDIEFTIVRGRGLLCSRRGQIWQTCKEISICLICC